MKIPLYLLLILLLLSTNTFSQTELLSSVTVGTKFDMVYEPITVQAEYSRSQTIYYPDEMRFRGTITSLKYFLEFSSSAFENSTIWRVAIGYTNKTEFAQGDPNIPDSELTEVFNGRISGSGNTVILTFDKPFYYDGRQNLVIDVQEIEPGKTASQLTTFKGVKNYNKPPTRTKITMTGVTAMYENSYACTEFGGSLERCEPLYAGTFSIVTATSVLANWPSNVISPAFRYMIQKLGDPMPTTYKVVNGKNVLLENLQPATGYTFYRKTDCDITPTNYYSQQFTTEPYNLKVPTTITFDGANTFDYFLTASKTVGVYISPIAASDSENGILFRGTDDLIKSGEWKTTTNDSWNDNPSFISRAYFTIDLTNYTGNPILQFDLRQTKDSKFKIATITNSDYVLIPGVYTSTTDNSDEFKTITIDLSKSNGTKFDLIMQHLGRYTTEALPYNTAFVDNVKLIEMPVCNPPQDIIVVKTENSITLNWTSAADEWEVAWVDHDMTAPNSGTVTKDKFFTITGLTVAKSYDIYIRNKYGNSYCEWKKIIESTNPTIVKVPYQQLFTAATTNYAPELQDISRQFLYSNALNFYQKLQGNGSAWVGGSTTTEHQAWNDNKAFSSGISFKVDATNVSSLKLAITMKQKYYYSKNTSWFRVLVNGVQQGSSRNPTTSYNDAYTTLNYDLPAYAGKVLDVTLEHCGRYMNNYYNNAPMDLTMVSNVQFNGQTLDIEGFKQKLGVKVFPMPSDGFIHFSHTEPIDEITVLGLNGKVLMTVSPKEKAQEITLNVASLATGIYIAKIKSNGTYQYTKILRQ